MGSSGAQSGDPGFGFLAFVSTHGNLAILGRESFDGPSRRVVPFASPTGGQSLVGHRAEIAQLVEHATENRGVASSILALGTTIRWSQTVNGRKWLSW